MRLQGSDLLHRYLAGFRIWCSTVQGLCLAASKTSITLLNTKAAVSAAGQRRALGAWSPVSMQDEEERGMHGHQSLHTK